MTEQLATTTRRATLRRRREARPPEQVEGIVPRHPFRWKKQGRSLRPPSSSFSLLLLLLLLLGGSKTSASAISTASASSSTSTSSSTSETDGSEKVVNLANDPCSRLATKRQIWDGLNMTDYDYQYRFVSKKKKVDGVFSGGSTGTRGGDTRRSSRGGGRRRGGGFLSVRVRNSAITWATYVRTGGMVSSGLTSQIPTIDELFDTLQAKCDDDDDDCPFALVGYSRKMGYPRRIDHTYGCAEGAYSITVRQLKEAPDGPNQSPSNPNLDNLGFNVARWNAARIAEYSYRYKWGRKRFVQVRVKNGKVVEVGGVLSRAPLTVGQMHKMIRNAIDRGALLGVSYNSELGYPTSVKIRNKSGKKVSIAITRMRIKDKGPDPVNPGPGVDREVSKALQLWTSIGVSDYNYLYERRCETGMPLDDCQPMCLAVRDGIIRTATFAPGAVGPSGGCDGGGGEDVPEDLADQLPTIEGLFNIMGAGGETTVVAVTFDPQRGYPTSGHVVYPDGGIPLVFTVSEFVEVVGGIFNL